MISLFRPGSWLGGPREVIIHAHQFKNAGTTLDASLSRSFAANFIDHRDDDAMRQGANYLGSWLQEHRSVQALSSHWITFPLPQRRRQRLHLLLMFRDPLERARSVYNFERRQQPAQTPGSIKAKEAGFLDYVRWQMLPAQGPALRNFHTRYCSGNYLGDDLEGLYELALATLNSTQCVGLVDRYLESMVLFEYLLRPQFPHIDLSFEVENTTGGHEGTLLQRRQAVLQTLKPVADEYLAANAFDLQLHQQAERRFEAALAGVPGLDQRLDEMQQRCQSLEAE